MILPKFSKKEIFLLFLIIVLSSLLRTWKLDVYPAGFHNDEAWTGLIARDILNKGYLGFWSDSALGQPSLFFYWTALLFRIFGDSVATVRLSFALLHVFSLPFLYLLVRFLFSSHAALFTVFFFGTGPTTLEFARRGDLPAVSIGFFPSLFFFITALQTGKWRYYLAAGLFLGLNNYTYHSYVLIAPILIAYAILFFLQNRIKIRKKHIFSFLTLIIIYLLVFSPLLMLCLKSPETVFGKFHSFSIFSPEGFRHIQSYAPSVHSVLDAIVYNLKVSLPIFYNGHDDSMGSHIFGPIQAIFFSVGLITAYKSARKKYGFFSYFLFVSLFLSSIFAVNAPTFRRFQASIFFAYIFTGVGAWTLLRLSVKLPKFFSKISIFIILVFSLLSGVSNAYSYFSRYSISPQTKAYAAYSLVVAANYLNTLPQNIRIYYYSNIAPINHETFRYLLSPNLQIEDRSEEWTEKYSLKRDTYYQPVEYLLFSDYLKRLNEIKARYPDGKTTEYKDTDGRVLFTSYYLP